MFVKICDEIEITETTNEFKKTNYKQLLKLSYEVKWEEIMGYADIEQATEFLVSNITEILEKSKQNSQKSQHKKGKKPWITVEIIKIINEKEKIYKRYKKKQK